MFLATDDARYITGQTLGVDAGAFYTPDEASTESNARIPSTTENSETKED
ncbi:MAG TPA: hypothetical protein VGH77_12620 [Streptosporangiaceae bacterium]